MAVADDFLPLDAVDLYAGVGAGRVVGVKGSRCRLRHHVPPGQGPAAYGYIGFLDALGAAVATALHAASRQAHDGEGGACAEAQ